jgi:hypothetical protein
LLETGLFSTVNIEAVTPFDIPEVRKYYLFCTDKIVLVFRKPVVAL